MTTSVICNYCKSEFQAKLSEVKRGYGKFCSKECGYTYRQRKLYNCIKCGSETFNPKFCSKSCSSSINNTLFPKKKRIEKPIKEKKPKLKELSLKDIKTSFSNTHSQYVRVTLHARNTYINANLPRFCINCGYSKCYQVCHINPIRSFPLDTQLSVVNSISNLIALCPNCHWEFDHGMLSLDDIKLNSHKTPPPGFEPEPKC